MLGVSTIISRVLILPLILRRYCTRRFLRLVCTIDASKTESESLLHVKDVVDILLDSVGFSMIPFAFFVWRGVVENVHPPDVFLFVMALLPWTFLWMYLVSLMSEIMKYRYAEGLSFRETLQELTLYTAEKKFGSTAFQLAIATLGMYWFFNWLVYIMKNPSADHYHVLVALFVSVASLVVLAVVVGWALDVFTRRLFGEALGKFLFATFVAGAVFHPLLGLLSTFLFSWAMFGKAKRRRGGGSRLCSFPIRRNASGADMDFCVSVLIALNNMLFAFLIWVLPRGYSAVMLAVALGLSSAFLLLCMPSLWLSLEAGVAALATAVFVLLILEDVIVEVVALAKAYLAAGAVAGLLAGALLALMVVATARPEAEAVPEIARELEVSVEAHILYSALFGVAVGVGFGMFISWLLAALLWRLLEPRVDLPRPLLLVTPGRRRLPRPRLLPSRTKRRRVDHGHRPRQYSKS
jgi:hypothetical protein